MATERWTVTSGPLQDRAALSEAFLDRTCRLLHDAGVSDPRRLSVLRSLELRNFPLAQLSALPLGLFLDPQAMKAELLSMGAAMPAINASRLLADARLAGRLVSPIRDLQGTIVSFWARHPQDEPPLYLFLHRQWPQAVPAIGLDIALAAGGDEELLLVEDPLDALLLHAHGLRNAAALGGSWRELNGDRWQRLFRAGATRVTLLAEPYLSNIAVLSALHEARRIARLGQVWVLSWPVLRSRLAGSYEGLAANPQLWTWIAVRRIAGRRYRLHSIQLPTYVAEPKLPEQWEPLPAADEPPVSRQLSAGRDTYCRLHDCDETVCFCFD